MLSSCSRASSRHGSLVINRPVTPCPLPGPATWLSMGPRPPPAIYHPTLALYTLAPRYLPPQAKRMTEAEAEARGEMTSLQKKLRRSELAREESEAKERMIAAREKQQLDGLAARLATAEDDAKKLRGELDAARLELDGARYELEVARSDDIEHAAREEAAAAELVETKRAAAEELERYRAREVLVEGQLAAEKQARKADQEDSYHQGRADILTMATLAMDQAREADREQWKSESLELVREGDETVR